MKKHIHTTIQSYLNESSSDKKDVLLMTKKINGGTIGLEDRKKHNEHNVEVLSA